MQRDQYLDESNVEERMLKEWREHGANYIIAYDFDSTVFPYHETGHTHNQVIELLRRCRKVGAKLIVWTAAAPPRYGGIIDYLQANDIPFDQINEDLLPKPFGGRKIYYNVLLDDRAGLASTYRNLFNVVQTIEKERGLF